MNIIGFSLLVATTGLSLLLPDVAHAQNHRLKANVLGGGGSPGQSRLHRHHGTLGQPHPVGVGGSRTSVLWSGFWRTGRGLAVARVGDLAPLTNRLWQNSPNPFNPQTTITFSITNPVYLELAVFDVRGQRVRTLVSEMRTPGIYNEVWDGRDETGGRAPSGVYLYRLVNGVHHQTAKMLLVK